MNKDFNKWNKTKKKIDIKNRIDVKVGEIFWCSLGLNIGVEQNGDFEKFNRPVIIIKKFSRQIVLIAPLTRQKHFGDWYLDINILNQQQQVILNQIKPVDVKRLGNSISQIPKVKVKSIIDKYITIIR
jgi:mRNA interferase MazF